MKKSGFDIPEKYYEHQSQPYSENSGTKILWDFKIYTDNIILARRPDIVLIDKQMKKTIIIDINCPADKNTTNPFKWSWKEYVRLKLPSSPLLLGVLDQAQTTSENMLNAQASTNSTYAFFKERHCLEVHESLEDTSLLSLIHI